MGEEGCSPPLLVVVGGGGGVGGGCGVIFEKLTHLS